MGLQLEEGNPTAAAQQQPQSFFEGLAQLKEPSAGSAARQLYRLVLIDEESGRPAAYPSDDDLFSLIQRGGLSRPVSAAAAVSGAAAAAAALDPNRERSFQEILAETVQKKGGPVCDHCSATESPQWRRGPPHKPVLCNACGTRFRRTNQLGPAVPSHLRKRSAQQHCSGQALKQAGGPVAKQPRVSVA